MEKFKEKIKKKKKEKRKLLENLQTGSNSNSFEKLEAKSKNINNPVNNINISQIKDNTNDDDVESIIDKKKQARVEINKSNLENKPNEKYKLESNDGFLKFKRAHGEIEDDNNKTTEEKNNENLINEKKRNPAIGKFSIDNKLVESRYKLIENELKLKEKESKAEEKLRIKQKHKEKRLRSKETDYLKHGLFDDEEENEEGDEEEENDKERKSGNKVYNAAADDEEEVINDDEDNNDSNEENQIETTQTTMNKSTRINKEHLRVKEDIAKKILLGKSEQKRNQILLNKSKKLLF